MEFVKLSLYLYVEVTISCMTGYVLRCHQLNQ